MMRSKRHRSMTPGQWLAHNPFLSIAIIAGLAMAAHSWQIGSQQVTEWIWLTLGYGFHVVALWLASVLPDLHGWVQMALIVTVGLIPYLLLDALWRRLRPS